jgi:hypothetical protein
MRFGQLYDRNLEALVIFVRCRGSFQLFIARFSTYSSVNLKKRESSGSISFERSGFEFGRYSMPPAAEAISSVCCMTE